MFSESLCGTTARCVRANAVKLVKFVQRGTVLWTHSSGNPITAVRRVLYFLLCALTWPAAFTRWECRDFIDRKCPFEVGVDCRLHSQAGAARFLRMLLLPSFGFLLDGHCAVT